MFPPIPETTSSLSFSQRWAHYVTLGAILSMVLLGIVLRETIRWRLTVYQDARTGIVAPYPANWLLDQSGADYVFRVRDMQALGFKTTIQLSIVPVGTATTERNIADRLAYERSQTLIDYRQLSTESIIVDDVSAEQVTYAYISRDTSPFTEAIPTVVLGTDIVVLTRGQALVITFRSEAGQYQDNYEYFRRFLAGLEY